MSYTDEHDYPDEQDVPPTETFSGDVRKSASIGKLAEALSAASAEFTEASKESTNPYFKNKYADLAVLIKATRPALAKHGIAVSQFPKMNGTRAGVTTIVAHSSGEWMEGDLTLPISKADAQGAGSAITYARRYSYQALLNIAGEDDDDGNAATGKTKKAEDNFLEKTGDTRASEPLVRAFQSAFKNSGKTEAQLTAILKTRYSANSPGDLSASELSELVKWAVGQEPMEQTLRTSVAAAQPASGTTVEARGTQTLIPDPEAPQGGVERIACRVNALVWKQAKGNKGVYGILEVFNDDSPGNFDIYSFDEKLNEILKNDSPTKKLCVFDIKRDAKGAKLVNIVEIAGIRYENGTPILEIDEVLGSGRSM